MGRHTQVSKLGIEKFVLECYSKGMSSNAIVRAVKEQRNLQISQKAILTYLSQNSIGGIRPLDRSNRSAQELIAEASEVYIELRKRAMRCPNQKERLALLAECRNWWDRIARVVGVVAPEQNLNITVNHNYLEFRNVVLDVVKNYPACMAELEARLANTVSPPEIVEAKLVDAPRDEAPDASEEA